MSFAHVHDILTMIETTGVAYTKPQLQAAIVSHFGDETRFGSCSIDGMDSEQAVEFLITRGKFVPQQAGSCCGSCTG
ncbi:MAG: YecH family protein [Gammaproteobacteria bacterium]|nr:YecH family protein [Gammaproteobacteria bacterium]MCP4878953.1 YecH family protein [Gammaproteobacteria bacterium]MDP6166078.1 YecH family protein [Gammaproteobacteria bacterium]